MTAQPVDCKQPLTMLFIKLPLVRESPPMITVDRSIYEPKANAYFVITSGVRLFPIIPRTPDIETINVDKTYSFL